ncbi:hypothetical protein LV457_08815 [Mycobacterium sp. MYCO198283]|uniref:hypothetical protein n=1 Tax=Mycobacterium sp. MYCO198283 TaxID=2883505 RepID=UPI001E403D63|nr:hypothetical protein [Mycobacterium sp. MYCO198283]MCG5432395.1 hypothetical protein [Mycobacterium sp. MYCO198283]
MLSKASIALAAVAAAVGVAAPAGAEPPPPPPPFDVLALPPLSPAEYSVLDGAWSGFAGPGGITCILDRHNGAYGCSGALPGAPDNANVVSGSQAGPPGFATAAGSPFAFAGPVKPLPANTRLGFRNVNCGSDGTSLVCLNTFDQTGFVITPGGSYLLGEAGPPLLDRSEGTNPFRN